MSVLHPDQFTQHLSDLEQNYGISIGPGHMRTENGLMIPISDWSANNWSDPASGFHDTLLQTSLPDEHGNIHHMDFQNDDETGALSVGGYTLRSPRGGWADHIRHDLNTTSAPSSVEEVWESMRSLGPPSSQMANHNQEILRDRAGWGNLRHIGNVTMVNATQDMEMAPPDSEMIEFGYDLGRRAAVAVRAARRPPKRPR